MKKTIGFISIIILSLPFYKCAAPADYTSTTTMPNQGSVNLEFSPYCTGLIGYQGEFTVWGTLSGDTGAVEKITVVYENTNVTAVLYDNAFIARISPAQTNGYLSVMLNVLLTNQGSEQFYKYFDITSDPGGVLFDRNAIFTNTANLQLSGTMTDVSNIDSFAIYYDNAYIDKTPTNVWSQTLNNIPEGINFIHAKIVVNTSEYTSFAVMLVADYTKPRVEEITPQNGQNTVARDQNIVVKFTEPVATNNIQNLIKILKEGTTPIAIGSYRFSDDFRQVTLDPAANFDTGENYTIFVSNAVIDRCGNTVASNCVYSFSTLMPPLSASPVFSGTYSIPITYPPNGTLDFRNMANNLQWSTSSYYDGVYKYYVLIATEPFEVQNGAIANKADIIKYWSSDIGKGTVGNIDLQNDLYDVVNGEATQATNIAFYAGEVLYILIYGVNREYVINSSSVQWIVRW